MTDYWESRFKEEGAMWKFEPSDSAILALELFKSNKINTILIPGFGYGRNGKLFYDNGFTITGIEISESAIRLAKANHIDCTVFNGSVTEMPFDNEEYDAVFCYALLHLLNKNERRTFLRACYKQLKTEGLMVFTVVSKQAAMYGTGKKVSSDRFLMNNVLCVYFYDSNSIEKEFSDFEIIECRDIDEPIKFMEGQEPLKCKFVICKKK